MKQHTDYQTERAWIEINRNHLRHNAAVLQRAMPPTCRLMADDNCDAYGHGDLLIAKELNRIGVQAFAVATIDEGVRLRKHGVRGEILILGYTGVNRAYELKRYDLMQTLIDFSYAEALNRQGISVKAHLKIDTGMHRLGISSDSISEVKAVFAMKNIQIQGIFTHLCCSDSRQAEDIAFTENQISRFYCLIDALKSSDITVPKLHIQSSYGLLNYPHLKCDYVRAGIALYGVLSAPQADTVQKLDLRPVLSLKSRVVLIRQVNMGETLGYGRSFTAARNSRIAVLPVGYGDGFPRSLSNSGSVQIRQHQVPIVGRICMDQLAVDITEAEDITVGDTAVLIHADACNVLSAPAVAEQTGSISNELLSRMGTRLPVVVKDDMVLNPVDLKQA